MTKSLLLLGFLLLVIQPNGIESCHSTSRKGKKSYTLFHYTGPVGIRNIQTNKFISSCVQCAWGKGVYMTELAPGIYEDSLTKEAVIDNNWGGMWPSLERDSRADFVVALHLDEDLVERVQDFPWNVWKTKSAGPLDLNDARIDWHQEGTFEEISSAMANFKEDFADIQGFPKADSSLGRG